MSHLSNRLRPLQRVLAVPDVRRLWLSQVLSELGDWAARLALAVLVLDRSGSAAWSAATLAVSFLPYLLSPWLTAAAQRWTLRRVLVGADALRAVLFAALVLPLPLPVLLAMTFVAGLGTPPFEAARVAVLPEAAGEHRLGDALALNQITFQAAQVVGFGVGGLLIAWLGPSPALLLNAATFALSGVLVFRLQAGRRAPDPEPPVERVRAAVVACVRRALLRRALLILLVSAVADAAISALLAAFAVEQGQGRALLAGLATAAPAAGVVAGALVARDGDSDRLLRAAARWILAGSVAGTVLLLLSAALPSGGLLAAVVAVLALAAYGTTLAGDVPTYVVAMRAVPDALRAPVVAVVQPALMGVQAFGALAAGVAAAAAGSAGIMVLALLVAAGVGLWALLVPVRRAEAAPVAEPERQRQSDDVDDAAPDVDDAVDVVDVRGQLLSAGE